MKARVAALTLALGANTAIFSSIARAATAPFIIDGPQRTYARSGSRLPTDGMAYKRRIVLLLISLTFIGAGLFWTTDNPFALRFQVGTLLLLGGVAGTLVTFIGLLLRSRIVPLRIAGLVLVATAVAIGTVLVWSLQRQRLLWCSDLSKTAWESDAAYLIELVPKAHPNAFAHGTRGTFTLASAALLTAASTGNTPMVEMAMVRLVASLQDGHSTIFPFQPATGFHMLPLQLSHFSDGWYVIDTSPTYSHLVGKQVLSIGDRSTDEAYAVVRPYIGADNGATAEDRAPWYLLCPEVLETIGISRKDDRVSFMVGDDAGHIEYATIAPVGLLTYLYWYFQPLQEWKHEPVQSSLPLYQQRVWDNYWSRYIPAERTMYVAFNQVRDKHGETFEQFGERVLRECDAQHADQLVIDVRNNSGGDNTIFADFITRLQTHRINQRGRLYLIIGRHTFSAAVNFTSAMELKTNAVLAGEDAGAGPNHYGDPKRYILPNSRLWVFVASRYHQWGAANDTRRTHEPSIRVTPTHRDYFGNRDPVLETILHRQAQ